jgi:hypothetical protein
MEEVTAELQQETQILRNQENARIIGVTATVTVAAVCSLVIRLILRLRKVERMEWEVS